MEDPPTGIKILSRTDPHREGQLIFNKGNSMGIEKMVFSVDDAGIIRKQTTNLHPTSHHIPSTILAKWTRDLNVKPKAIKLPEENIRRNSVTLV